MADISRKSTPKRAKPSLPLAIWGVWIPAQIPIVRYRGRAATRVVFIKTPSLFLFRLEERALTLLLAMSVHMTFIQANSNGRFIVCRHPASLAPIHGRRKP